MPARSKIPLADAIAALRAELAEAIAEGEGKDLRFGLGPIQLVLEAEVAIGAEASASGKLWFLSLGGGASRATTRTHTIHLTLEPQNPQGERVKVAEQPPKTVG